MKLIPILGNEPLWLLKEAEMAALGKGALVLDCPEMTLTSRGSDSQRTTYSGSGVLIQNPEGPGFVCRLQLPRPLSTDAVFAMSRLPAGVLIPNHLTYDLVATDWRGRRWTAEHLLIHASSGANSTTIVANIHTLQSEQQFQHLGERNSVSALYWGDLVIPYTGWTEYCLTFADGNQLDSGSLDNVKLSLPGITASLHRYLDFLRVDLISNDPILPKSMAHFNDALQFVLARNLNWSVLHHVTGTRVVMHVRGRLDPPATSRRGAPLAYSSVGPAEIWALFECYYRFLLDNEPKQKYHPITERVYSVIQSGTQLFVDDGRTLAVAVEGLVKDLHSNISVTQQVSKVDLKTAKKAIEELGLDEQISKRFQTLLEQARQVRAIDHLYAMAERGNVQKQLVIEWKELRNAAAHGHVPEAEQFVDLLARSAAVQTLFYQLIFLAIGYSGPYTDYSEPGYPQRIFYGSNLTVKE